jgi:peptidoglycan/LPS O-acetylase OafA/YrhL
MIPGLDGIRAVAMIIILNFHVGGFQFGWLTVQSFFVLSGFLITGILLRMKETLPARQFFGRFYGRRFLRIFPLYYFYLFILTALVLFSGAILLKPLREEIQTFVQPQLWQAYAYLFDFRYGSALFRDTPFMTHLWTLSVEEQFYLLWPVAILLTPTEKLKTLFITLIVAAPIFRLVTYVTVSNGLLLPYVEDPFRAVYASPLSHLDGFAFGAYITAYKFPNPRKQLWVMAILLPLAGYLTQYFAYGSISLDTFGYEFNMVSGYKFVWGYTVTNYFFAVFIQAVVQNGLFVRFLHHPILQYLGKISYGLYVYHFPIIFFLILLRPKYKAVFSPSLEFLFLFLSALALTILAASLSYRFLEKPINDLKDKWFPLKAS